MGCNAQLHQIIDDLRAEKRLLEKEQSKLLGAQFGRDRENEYHEEIEELHSKVKQHTRALEDHLDEKSQMKEEIDSLRGDIVHLSFSNSKIHY